MTFQHGNQLHKLATHPKPFRDALMAEIKSAGEDYRSLRLVARGLLRVAQRGNVAAIKEVADRIDGKVPQALVADEGSGPIVLQVVRYVVDQPPQVIDITPDSAPKQDEPIITNDVTIEQDQYVTDDGLTQG